MPKHSLGIDVGGTNTDFAIVDNSGKLLCSHKTYSTYPIEEGITVGLAVLRTRYPNEYASIGCVNIGTTQVANAVLEANRLSSVGVIRMNGCLTPQPQPAYDWPEELRKAIVVRCRPIGGGFECDGRPMSHFSLREVSRAVDELLSMGAETLAVAGSFSPIYPEQELEIGRYIEKMLGPEFPYTLSHMIGGMGIIEREKATILNSALIPLLGHSFRGLASLVRSCGLNVEVWMTQNNGTLFSVEEAGRYPLKTVSAGPTNSFIGGSKLAIANNAIVIDVGGTSTDIGVVESGVLRRSLRATAIGGVSLTFSMPDSCSMAIGGGTHIGKGAMGKWIVGPKSCGHSLPEVSQIFGGSQLTLTDLSCVLGDMEVTDGLVSRVKIGRSEADDIVRSIGKQTVWEIYKLSRGTQNSSVVLVGGAAGVLKRILQEEFTTSLSLAPFSAVANAYGAALTEIGATKTCVVAQENRLKVLDLLRQEAIDQAIKNGANPNGVRITQVEMTPIPYSANHLTKLVVDASGRRW